MSSQSGGSSIAGMIGPINGSRSSYGRIDGSRIEARVGIDPTNRGSANPITGHPIFLIATRNVLIQMSMRFSVRPRECEGDWRA